MILSLRCYRGDDCVTAVDLHSFTQVKSIVVHSFVQLELDYSKAVCEVSEWMSE